MDVFEDARASESEMLNALRSMEEEEARLFADARSVGENMRDARLLANRIAGKTTRDLGQGAAVPPRPQAGGASPRPPRPRRFLGES